MTSDLNEVYVWIWLPGEIEPVVAGRLRKENGSIGFTYGRSYLERPEAVPIFTPELPLSSEVTFPPIGSALPNSILDASPDAWGRRVIDRRMLEEGIATGADELDYLIRSGSDRVGALDFQLSATEYVRRGDGAASLDDLASAASIVDEQLPLHADLHQALLQGSSAGGARPKALLVDGRRRLIAKFSSSTDQYPIVKGEFLAMQLADRVGLDVAGTELTTAMGKDALLVERFDREVDGSRRGVVSGLTLLDLPETAQIEGSYAALAAVVRERFTEPKQTLRELFARVAFNILSGNTDDHLRNHSAFWNGSELSLTPAYDICPYPRTGEASQATAIADGYRRSNLDGLISRSSIFQLSASEARELVDEQVSTVRRDWAEVCDLAELTAVERSLFWERQFLNPAIFYPES